jgi:hypothetical protein
MLSSASAVSLVLVVRISVSASLILVGSSVALISMVLVPLGPFIIKPFSFIASTCLLLAIRVTSEPDSASSPPTRDPKDPAPKIMNLIILSLQENSYQVAKDFASNM